MIPQSTSTSVQKTASMHSDLTQEDVDVEAASTSHSTTGLLTDPFKLRQGLATDEQIAELRQRKKGKTAAKYQQKQNIVGIFRHLLFSGLSTFCTAHQLLAETDGRAYGGREGGRRSHPITCVYPSRGLHEVESHHPCLL